MSKLRINIARDVIAFMSSSLIVQGISFFVAIYIRRILGPEAMGIWAALQIFLRYASYANLGMFDAMYREIPLRRGRGDEAGVQKIKNTAFTFTFAASSLGSLAILGAAFYFRPTLQPLMFYGLVTLSIVNLLQKLNDLFLGILQSEKKFEFTSRFRIYSAVVNTLLVVVLIVKYGLCGYYAATVLSFVFNVVYLGWRGNVRVRFVRDKAKTTELLRFGLPFFALSFVNTLCNTADKAVIAKFFGLAPLGIYTLATMAGRYLALLPNILQQVLFPRILERFGEKNNAQALKTVATKPSHMVSAYFSLFIGLAWINSPYLCQTFLPKFTEGIAPLKILIFGFAFMALSTQLYPMILGYFRHWWLGPVSLLCAGIIAGGGWLVHEAGGSITDVAAVTAGAYLVGYFFNFWFALGPSYRPLELVREWLLNLTPLFFSFVTLLALDRIGVPMTLASAAGQTALYMALWVGLVLLMEKRLGIIQMIKDTYFFWQKNKRPLVPEQEAVALGSAGDV